MSALFSMQSLETRRLLTANLVADAGGIYPTDSVTSNGISYFTANDGVHGQELWKSDGTEQGTKMVKDITPGQGGSELWSITPYQNGVMFYLRGSKVTLWKSDGTDTGTQQIATLPNGADVGLPHTVANGLFLFIVESGQGKPIELWASDGTTAGTSKIVTLVATNPVMALNDMYSVGDRATFFMDQVLWSTDGTAAGTFTISAPDNYIDFGEATDPGWAVQLDSEISFNGKMIFIDEMRHTIWQTDGTAAGTQPVVDPGSNVDWVQSLNGNLYFRTNDPDQLWVSDGTPEGTQSLGELPGQPSGLSSIGGNECLFTITHGPDHLGTDIWKTDGTAAGTHLVTTLDAVYEIEMIGCRNLGYFLATNANGVTLWETDGTAVGTAVLNDALPSGSNSTDLTLVAVDGKASLSLTEDPREFSVLYDPASPDQPMALNEATTHLSNGTLRVFGTMGDDNTRIYRAPADPTRLTVVLNGVRKTFALADVQNIYVYGYSGDDSIAVYEGHGQVLARSHMWGGYGDDTLYTGSARDTVYGEEGNDYLSGGRNNDSIDGGDGNDTIDCGAGNDTACGDNGSDNLIGGAGLDMLSGGTDGCKDQINGGAGQDVIFGNAVIDIFYGASLGDDAPSADQILSG